MALDPTRQSRAKSSALRAGRVSAPVVLEETEMRSND